MLPVAAGDEDVSMTRGLIISVAAAALALSGCAKKPPEALPPAPGSFTEGGADAGSSGAILPGTQADFVARMRGQDTIYFDTDRFNIDSADAAALQQQAAWLRQYPQARATIEGHCDERGTREYNVALGERRANAAKNYLVSLGVEPARLTVVSYGKERPIALGSDESAWARNRRAVTLIIE
jgi:peptidoglycan-associated lipoprotein